MQNANETLGSPEVATSVQDLLQDPITGPLWEHFVQISSMPRPSLGEEMVLAHLAEWAAANGFAVKNDVVKIETDGVETEKDGNLAIHVPGRGAGADKPPVIIQAHADMVGSKTKDSTHDFTRDPLTLVRNADTPHLLQADGTTLGADNGIGLSAALAVATDATMSDCPPLIILVTIDEEEDFTGAEQMDAAALGLTEAAALINVDGEDATQIFIKHSGHADLKGEGDFTFEDLPSLPGKFFTVELGGFQGGHSGMDIHEKRGNPILELIAFLKVLSPEFRLVGMQGGEKPNAIPRDAEATIFVPAAETLNFRDYLLEFRDRLQTDFADVSMGATEVSRRSVQRVPVEAEKLAGVRTLQHAERDNLINVLQDVPNGVLEVDGEIAGLTRASSNLGTVGTNGDRLNVGVTVRGDETNLKQLSSKVQNQLNGGGFAMRQSSYGPAWEQSGASPMVTLAQRAHAHINGSAAELTGVHATFEVGSVSKSIEKVTDKKIDSVAFGPTITNVHSPDEAVWIDTVKPFYEQLQYMLQALARGE